ncbi:hypothetical protein ACS0TY_011679 [Phlomoides rotata]
MEAQTHIAIFPTPGMGHQIPLIELARKLLHLHNFSVTIIIPYDGSPTQPLKSLLQTLPAINTIFLPPPTAGHLPENANIEDRMILDVVRSIPSLCEALTELKHSTRLAALIVDNFGVSAFDSVKELGIPVYLFLLCSAMILSFALHLPQLHDSCTSDNTDFPEPVQFPGCVPVRVSDLPDPVLDRKSETYRGCVDVCRKYSSVDGILVNSFLDLEPDTFKAFEQGAWPPIYPVGPLVRSESGDDTAECLRWLNNQPAGSVLFVSFGSGGTLSRGQLKELALGLEMSEQRFVMIVREPNDESKNAAYFTSSEMDPNSYLPSGFIERTKEKGLVLVHWGPQVEILNHRSVGGFLSHCGWNSTLESIVYGVPLIAWPLFAEQRMNAVLLSEDLKVALRVKENENGGGVDSEQISMLVRRLMKGGVGEEIRIRMGKLKEAAHRALSRDGCSTKSLASVAEKWNTEIAP